MSNPPAFPTVPLNHGYDVNTHANGTPADCGMSLRDYFAAHALSGVSGYVATGSHLDPQAVSHAHTIAAHAYMIADVMLAVREEPPLTKT